MDLETVLTEIRTWPPADRLRLIEEVWDGLSDDLPFTDLTDDLQALLTRRMDALDADPANVLTWDQIESYVTQPR